MARASLAEQRLETSREPKWSSRSRSCPLHEGQLSAPSVEQAHDPSSRFAAVALVWIVRASAAPSTGEVTLAMGLGAKIDILIGIGHGCAIPTISSTCTPDPEQSFPDPSRAERVGTVECSGSASNLLVSYPQGRTGRPRSQQEGPVRAAE